MISIRMVTAMVALAVALLAPSSAGAKGPTPIVFVHGNFGSAQQFETNAMRLTSNGFPQDRIHAYEYDTLPPSNDVAISNLETFIEDVKEEHGSKRVDVLAHSRGTTVMHASLGDAERAKSVKHYVNLDGRSAESPPGGVPTLAIWGEGDQTRKIVGAKNVYFPEKAHTQVATSAPAFAHAYRFLRGRKARTRQVKPERPGKVTIAGRSIIFPNNNGNAGAQLDVYEVEAKTGHRISEEPIHSQIIPADGSFGPLSVNGRKHLEFSVDLPGPAPQTIHTYTEPFERSNHFVRLLDAPILRPFAEYGLESSGVVVLRMHEFWGGQANPASNDVLRIGGVNVINENTTPRERRVLAVFTFDKNSDGKSDTSQALFPFSEISFLTGVDVFNQASLDASGTVPVVTRMRGKRRHKEKINVPNPSSLTDINVTFFKDYVAKRFRAR